MPLGLLSWRMCRVASYPSLQAASQEVRRPHGHSSPRPSGGNGGRVPVATDCEHVCRGAAITGLEGRLLWDGANRDLTARLLACQPRLRRVRAHPGQRVSESDWRLSRVADEAARAAACAGGGRATRCVDFRALEVVLDVVAVVEVAAFVAKHGVRPLVRRRPCYPRIGQFDCSGWSSSPRLPQRETHIRCPRCSDAPPWGLSDRQHLCASCADRPGSRKAQAPMSTAGGRADARRAWEVDGRVGRGATAGHLQSCLGGIQAVASWRV